MSKSRSPTRLTAWTMRLLKWCSASQIALERLLDHGADFEDSKIRKALDELNDLEDEFLNVVKTVGRCAQASRSRRSGSACLRTCRQAASMPARRRRPSRPRSPSRRARRLRKQREGAARVDPLSSLQNYGTLASGILIGLSEGLEAWAAPARRRRRKPRRGRRSR